MNDDAEIEALMRRCQQGFAGRPSVVYEQANQFAAACYGTIGRLKLERDALAEELSIRNGGPSKLLQGMQRIGWPCGAVELPLEFQRITALLNQTREAYFGLRTERDVYKARVAELEAEKAAANTKAHLYGEALVEIERWKRSWDALRVGRLEDQQTILELRNEVAALTTQIARKDEQ